MNQVPLLFNKTEIIVDNFAGGGGASTGIEMGFARLGEKDVGMVDIAINHDMEAVTMHAANHPYTHHYCEDVWTIDPLQVTQGCPVRLAWFSPDCKHFSKAKGGKPVEKKIRGLAWIVVKWAKLVRPRVIMLENVEEFETWGPLLKNGMPCPERKGLTFRRWIKQLENLGYRVEMKVLRACDYGTPTIRKRLFIVARCDSQPIVWPAPTHAKDGANGLLPWRSAAECIDWDIPCPSIFERKKPLAENTLRRIARGIMQYVINAKQPFIVPLTHGGGDRVEPVTEPLRTTTTAHRGERALVAPILSTYYGDKRPTDARGGAPNKAPLATQTTENRHAVIAATLVGAGGPAYSGKPKPVDEPLGTASTENHRALVTAFLAKHYTGVVGSDLPEPIGTVTAADHHSVVTAHMLKFRGDSAGSPATDPLHTITAGGDMKRDAGSPHALGVAVSHLVKLKGTCKDGQTVDEPMPTVQAMGTHIAEVRAFLMKYYGTGGQLSDPRDPMHTFSAKARMALVTIEGIEYQITDIGMRMLTPLELYRAQGFPSDYIIDPVVNGKPLTKTAQVRMCGNSVCPPVAAALVEANFAAEYVITEEQAA